MGSKQSKIAENVEKHNGRTGKEVNKLQEQRQQHHSDHSVLPEDKQDTKHLRSEVKNNGTSAPVDKVTPILSKHVDIISPSKQTEEVYCTAENQEQGQDSGSLVKILDGDSPGNHDDHTDILPITCIPPEVWEQVFGHLQDFRDCISVSNVCPYWKNVLSSTRQSWLFILVFPYLLDYLSKNEVLRCRLICKYWYSGVNHFFENNCYHRPALELVTRQINGIDRTISFTDLRLQQLETALRTKKLAYVNLYEAEKMNKILLETARINTAQQLQQQQQKCPVLGRSVDMLESHRAPQPPPNLQFLKTLGHHLWFLRLVIENYPPAETLTRIFELITHVPNLKKLKIIAIIVPPRTPTEILSQNFLDNLRINPGDLPKLETLDLTILPTRHVKMVEVLLKYFGKNNLQTLSINVLPTVSIWTSMEMKNLTYLSLSLDTNSRLKSLLELKSPLQRLSLRLHGRVKAAILFQVVHHFRASLRNLSLNFSLDFFIGETLPCINLPVQLLPFSNPNILEGDFPHLKRAFLSSCRPISCNFLCGLNKSLEYLHIFMEEMGQWDKFLREGFPLQEWTERLDLLEYLKRLSSSNKLEMYRSNVWKVFPRLKVLTVQVFSVKEHKKGAEWEYRRNVYDKLQSEDKKLL